MQRVAQDIAAVAWPSFLAAALLELMVFAFVDPHLLAGEHATAAFSATAVYSLAFFVFWGCAAAACTLTLLLRR